MPANIRTIALALTFASFVLASYAADVSQLDDKSLAGDSRYDRCLELVKRNAQDAVGAAEAWRIAKGGAAALHCEALALTQLHRYAEAAQKLDEAAHDPTVRNPGMEAALFDQAGNAWMLANRPDRAIASLSSALRFSPSDTDILADRARAKAQAKDWNGTEADLSAILALDPQRADIHVLRASAREAQGRRVDANADIAQALALYPNYPEALVERGNMKFEAGDQAGAKADWEQALSEAPNSDAGAAARARLIELAQSKAASAGQ
jgi:tetratricopeptide (TPR) repeat protein